MMTSGCASRGLTVQGPRSIGSPASSAASLQPYALLERHIPGITADSIEERIVLYIENLSFVRLGAFVELSDRIVRVVQERIHNGQLIVRRPVHFHLLDYP